MKKKNLISFIVALIFTLAQIGFSINVSAETTGEVTKINTISPTELQLVGNQLQPEGKTVTLLGDNKSNLTGKYDAKTKNFIISNGSITSGVNYKVSADWTTIPESHSQIAIPIVINTKQLSPNKIQVTYDRDVDLQAATKQGNYWIQSNEDKPTGIATLGKFDKVDVKNALTPNKVDIKPVEGSKKAFVLTFKENITPKMQYKIIVCYVTVPGGTGFTGDNIGSAGNNTFIGK